MKVEFHCQCPDCGGVSVFERDMRYAGNVPQIHIPFSVAENEWKCKGCGIVWHAEVSLHNMTEECEAEDGDMPLIEGMSDLGKIKAGNGGGLSIG